MRFTPILPRISESLHGLSPGGKMNLRLLQLGDSALPIGGYSHSWGLEAAIDRKLVRDAASLEGRVRTWLVHVVGPLEGVIVASVARAVGNEDWPAVVQANDLPQASLT